MFSCDNLKCNNTKEDTVVKQKLLAALMIITLCVSGSASVMAAENESIMKDVTEEKQEAEDTFTEDNVSEKNKLSSPTNVQWTDDWDMQWKCVSEAMGHYDFIIEKNGEQYETSSWEIGNEDGIVTANESAFIMESGVYRFAVRAANDYDPDRFEASDYVYSEERTYVRPSRELGTTVGYWDKEKDGIFYYNGVDGAAGYYVSLYKTDGDGNEYSISGEWSVEKDGFKDSIDNLHTKDFTNDIKEAGKYRVTVRALSGNIDEIANGAEGEKSDYFDTTSSSSSIKDFFDNLDKTDPNAALSSLKNQFNIEKIRTAMQTDGDILNQMQELETSYATQNGITTSNQVSAEAAAYVDTNKISMIGAALNAISGPVMLKVTVPESKVDVDTNRYANSVQLDLKLDADGQSKDTLDVPITITMPIPAGIESSHLTILHYHADDTAEVISPRDNGDGTVTFTITKFSTFVFANEKTETESGTPANPTTENPTVTNPAPQASTMPEVQTKQEEGSATASEENQIVSPKTEQNNFDVFAAIIAFTSLGGAVLYAGKMKQIKK